MELVRALREQLDKMTARLAWIERQGVTGRNRRLEATWLRRDINEAQLLIDRLQRRYLNGEECTQQHPAGRQRSGAADDCYISGFTESGELGR